MELKFSETGTIASYKRLSYDYAYALAEFLDNSTFAAELRISELKRANPDYKLCIDITYEPKGGLEGRGYIEIQDNAGGMTREVLERALIIGKAPEVIGRSRYGMGMKTAAIWMGNRITIRTKALGGTKEYEVILDLSKIGTGDFNLPFREIEKADKNLSYTIIRVELLDQIPYGKSIGKIKEQLKSIYREDTRKGILVMRWNEVELAWDDTEWKFIPAEDGNGVYRKNFDFEFVRSDGVKKRAYGWVGVLLDGRRSRAGFSSLTGNRVIVGYPEAWKPENIYGDAGGSNNLINQRLTGEIHLDSFDVTHTKDDFKWHLDEYHLVCEKLKEVCADYMHKAASFEKRGGNKPRPTDQQKQEAINDLKDEAESTQIVDVVGPKSDFVNPELIDKLTGIAVRKIASSREPRLTVNYGPNMTVKLYTHDGEISGSYLQIASNDPNSVSIIVNESHPAFPGEGEMEALRAWYRMCFFDGLAEFQCQKLTGEIKPNTVREYKDMLYRAHIQIEQQA